MVRGIIYIFTIFYSSMSLAETLLSAETDANKFYKGFRELVLANERNKVSELFAYPFSNQVRTKAELLEQYETVFTEHLVSLIKCTYTLEQVGWRGYMLSAGALWVDGQYFGDINPIKGSPSYVDDTRAKVADTQNWFMRIQGVNQDVGKCENNS
ncbi:hypothetical protein [Pseudoalteromonas luteoviolacea]|uniref:Uncharacterized protein n=1 Tax=Pseudoalteromonas luteoviolacea H33 TaxID=1365251 RepID=A0A162A7H8_9GAMM|nr:hypothetical protein [Pseudoalteromonas luteoviolacea]KZN45938.1 hypothetical protein N476_24675 [Pseudoalteromonas luteoviolacea H33]KZN71227.1 hypothetical protein N477_25695 [Pseudoalteromonas luteoviolacea H33-S]MBQ4880373.1 hypothetical protein [Pseudoalteromonas luteoviolacea]MBQ4909446.1 hypothetical protein [Pseudoalteromonas luteoviolacea]